ncbi:phosphopyruvate hydratase [Streptomyces sp. 8L]|uniref:phosphopyruvate hydratase n=1 Tax=Streptomyces sp. 8L TaxID=2877242 RepID=UPI001CD76E36|nr:phosphopyruvate hydratase [Streptomyces sp. 8L]MCA1218542.1 phosphopyruvate hydratase [Streptomyces sp. 8L]
MSVIRTVRAREILDGRGVPALEVDVRLACGATGRASVAGAVTRGAFAAEIRDGGTRYGGAGLRTAVTSVAGEAEPALAGRSALDQREIDTLLIELDGTRLKSRLGGNVLLGVSLAVARAAAESRRLPLAAHLAGPGATTLPVPLMNVLSGARGDGRAAVQEFMIVPLGAPSFAEAVRWGSEIWHALKDVLAAAGVAAPTTDEGSFAPHVADDRAALDWVTSAIGRAGLAPGRDVGLALDVGISPGGDGRYDRAGRPRDAEGLAEVYGDWLGSYPLVSLEDPLGGEDWAGWAELTRLLGDRVQLVGDALFLTGAGRLRTGIERKAANAFLAKPGQAGTVTETLDAIALAHTSGYRCVMSHRTGETDDTAVADLAVASGCGQLKSGAPVRGERVAKYNQLIRIAEELGPRAVYPGPRAFTPRPSRVPSP